MPVFKDSKDREWIVTINLGTCRRTKSATGFDFLASDENSNPLLKLASDYLLLADVLWTIVEPQATNLKVSVEDFIESLSGDCIENAVNAIAEAYVNFTPNPQRRELLLKLWTKIKSIEKTMLERAEKQVETATIGD